MSMTATGLKAHEQSGTTTSTAISATGQRLACLVLTSVVSELLCCSVCRLLRGCRPLLVFVRVQLLGQNPLADVEPSSEEPAAGQLPGAAKVKDDETSRSMLLHSC